MACYRPKFKRSQHNHVDELLAANIKPCDEKCERNKAAVFHVACASFAIHTLKTAFMSPAFLHATEYSFNPANEASRFRRIQMLLVNKFRGMEPRLTIEIWAKIAGYLVPRAAIVSQSSFSGILVPRPTDTETSRVATGFRGAHTINIEGGLWADYINIEGRRYINRLSTRAIPGMTRLFIPSQRYEWPRFLYVMEDHLGIRQINFDSWRFPVYSTYPLPRQRLGERWSQFPRA